MVGSIPILVVLGTCFLGGTCEAVCESSNTNAGWVFSAKEGDSYYSCKSSNGGTNDINGNAPTMCANDVASVRIEVQRGEAECLVATAGACGIPMHNFTSLDYDVSFDRCEGIWAAPLWMTPHTWQWGPGSGEIDSLEFCPRTSPWMNFAGGGHQVSLAEWSLQQSEGHVTVRKDVEGIVTIKACAMSEVLSIGQCPEPSYSNCEECLGANDFACWCNENSTPPNIYGSGGCQNGGDCIWTLVSDVWNGVSGDAGYDGCMVADDSIGLAAGKPNLNSDCTISVENIVVRGDGPDGSLEFAKGSPPSCSALAVRGRALPS